MNAFRSDSTWVRAVWRALYPLRLLGLLGLSGYAMAGPTGGQVTTGSGQITQSGTTTTVQQNSQTLGLDWSSFNVAANETVNFVQPGKNSVAVNEISSPGGSEILGHLNANGQVWLINPNGILFGSNAEVNVGGLVASTLAPGASDGTGFHSFSGTGAGSIVNQGTINAAKGGYVALLGNSVSNQGVVRAQLGTAALGAGSAATLTFAGNKLLQIEVDRNTLNALAENKGLIEADGGTVYMTAGAANSLLASSVNTTGVIRAKSVENHDGKIVLGAGLPAGTVTIEGLLDVSSDRGVGGEVTATAGSVEVGPNATVNASGSAGGGAIRIGGGWEGGEGVPQATTVTVANSATLDASATAAGNGGEIVVRSDVADMNSTAEVAGTLLAQGGVNGGNGGRIETSAHVLDVDGITANASAPKGNGGEWLLDPYNVTIGSSTSGNTYSPPNFSPTSSDSTILASTISTALSGGSSVTITTGSSGSSLGDITVNSAITKSSGSTDVTLTLQAADSIVVNQAISNTGGTGKLNVSLLADNDNGTHDGVGSILLNNSISTGGGYIQFGNGATMTLNGVSTLVGGDVYVGGSSAINLTTGGGAVTFNGQTLIANTSGLSINTTGSTNGNVSFGSSIDSADSYTYVSSQMSWNAALAAAASGTGANVGDTFLATPSTRLQNAEASAAAGYQSAWLGGERGGNGNPGGSAIWYWVSGPLGLANGGTGTPFFTQNGSSTTNGSGGTAINGAYTNWNAGEPNNSGGSNLTSSGRGEWVMQFTGAQANWNDLNPTTNNLGYVVETNLAASPLTINTGTGTVSIAGPVGAAKALASLSVNAGSIAVNGTALITNGAQTYNNALTINSSGAFHLSDSSLSITNPNQALSLTATGSVTIDGPSSVAGPISIYGSNITVDSGASLTSTPANQGILLKATGGITDGANLTTNRGDITLWANSAGASTGGIQVSNGVTLSSSGGAITLGGSANNATISGLPATSANGTTLPQGYAENLSGTFGGVVLGTYAGTTGENANVTINSGNGNISMAGQSNQYVNGVSIGMYAYEGINVNAGNGNITLNGLSTGATAGQNDFGTTLAAWYTAATAASKWQTNGGNITINGTASGATGTTFGADLQGGSNGTTVTIENTGASSGGITVNGYASNGTSSNYGIRTINTNILSSSGAISLDANAVGSTFIQAGYTTTLGYLANSDVTASSANVNLTGDGLSISGALNVNGTGTLTVQPYSNSFASAVSTAGLTLGSGLTGFTLGKAGNTAALTVASADSIAGPISIYGGTINLNANLASTASGAEILLKSSGNIAEAASTSTTSNGGNIVYWSDSNAVGNGSIALSSGDTLSSNGGMLVLAGGADNGSGMPGGYAASSTAGVAGLAIGPGGGTYGGTTIGLNSGGGNIVLRGAGTASNNDGIWSQAAFTINSGTGTVTMLGTSTGNNGIELSTNGYAPNYAITSANTTAQAIDIEGTAAGSIGLWLSNNSSGNALIQATGTGGGVTLKGTSTAAGGGIYFPSGSGTTQILAQSGPINLTGIAASGSNEFVSNGSLYVGNRENSTSVDGVTPAVSSSSSNITLTSDALTFGSTGTISSTGTLTVQPYDTSFSSALTWPQSNLAVGSGLTGLTLGKAGNTANITVSSAQSIAGPITIYGGNIILNAGLTTSNTTTGSIGLTASTGVSGSGNISLASGEALTITQAGNTTYGGVISGSGSSFTNAGAGTLTLTGTNTYTGATTLSAGTLQLGNGGTTGTLATSGVTNNANLAFNLSADTTIPYAIGGSGAVQVTGQQETLFSSFLTTTPVNIATNTTVAEVAARLSGGQMAGNSVLNGTPAQAGVYEVNFNPATNTANFQVQEYEPNGGNYTKVVFVKLTQSGSNVQAVIDTSGNHALGTGYVSGNELGTDLSVGNLSSLGLAISASGNGYGLDALYEAAKITFTGANTYSGLTTISNTTTSVSSGSTSSNPLSYYSQTAPGTLQIGNGGTFGTGNVSDAGLLLFNTTASQTIANAISGSGAMMQSGSGTQTLTGANTYTGLTTVNAGKLQIGAGGTLGSISSSSTIDLASSGISFVVDRSDNLSMGNVIAGVGGVEKMGADNLTLTANSSYSGATNIDGGALILQNDAPTTGGTTFNGPGTLTVQSASAAFAGAFSTSGWNFGSTLTGLTLGKTTNTQNMTIAGAASVAGPISIYGGNLAVNAGLTATGINTLSLTGTGNVTEGASGYVSANSLALLGGNVTLTNANNAIGTLAASGVGALTFSDSNALTLGTVGSTNGVSATGAVSIGTATGNLTVAQTVATTNATSSALVLDAGANTAAGTASGGDIVLSGSPTVSVGTGGTAKLYTGSLSGSTGLGALVGVGSGHFRYDADENTNFATGAWANLGTGIYGIYREQPTITLGVNNQSMTYGNATPTWTFTLGGAQNGDTLGQIFASSPTVTVGGSTSTSGNYTAGSHTLTVSGNLGASDLGYAYTGGSNTAGTLAVGQRTLTVGYTGVNKTYDGTTSATVTTSDNRIANDVLTIAYTAAFGDKDVGTNVAVNVSGANLVGTDAGNYAIASTSGSTTANITPFALTVTGSTVTPKTYDGTTAATITGGALNGVFSVDQGYVSLTQSGTFATKNAGTGIAVTATDALVLTGTAAGDYTLTQPTGLTGTITPLALTVTGSTVVSKTYDGTTTATITGGALNGVLPADLGYVSLATQGGTFASKNAGTGIAVTATDTITATGTAAGDYTLTEPTGLTANITPFALTVTGSTVTPKTYDGTTTATITGGALNGVFSVDQGNVSLTQSGTFASKNVGTGIAVTATDALVLTGGAVGDYTLNEPTGLTGSITPFALTVTGSTVTPKTYDGTTAATITGGALIGVLPADLPYVSLATQGGTFASKNAGTGIAVTATDTITATGTAAGDYTLTQPTGLTGTITPLALTVTGSTVASKTYDGTTAATITGGALNGVLPADLAYVSLATQGGTFASKNAGTGIAVTATDTITATGTAAGDYTLTEPTGLTANITPFALTVTGSTVTPKTYDGTTAATITGGALNGVFSVDQGYVSLTQSGTFATKNVGTGIAVTATDALVLTGTAAGDYTLNEPTGLTGNITPFALTVTGSTVTPKTYDGTTAATITGGALIGVLPADLPYVSLATQGGTFASKNAGTGIAVTATDTITATGTAAGDYTLTQPTGLTGTITPLALTVTGSTVASKTYDGTTAATITGGALNGVLPADQPYVSLATQGGTFASKNAGTGIAVTATDTIAATGTAAGDYTLTEPTGLTANITPFALTVTGSTVTPKTYDGTTAATITGGALNGVFSVDQAYVSLTQSGSFATKNAGTGIAVTATDAITATGTAAGDYTLTEPTGLIGNITPKPITVQGSTGVNKTYDGTTSLASSVTGYGNPTGFINGDAVSVTGGPVYSSADAGLRSLQQGTVTLSGNDASNYSLSWVNGSGTISPAPLTVTANADARFIGLTDTAGYNGVSYQGFVAGQTSSVLGGALSITRSNAGVGAAGTYNGVLVPSGLTSNDYNITFVPGNYTIVPADELLVRANNVSTTYGSTPVYAITSVQYLNGNNVLLTLSQTGVNGSTYTYADGVGGTATFTLGASAPVISGSGHLAAGNYAISDSSFTSTGANFTGTPVFVGELSVDPLGITASATTPPSKTYDGTTSMSGTSIGLSGVLSGDRVTGSGIGTFTTKDAGTGLAYSLNGLTLTGADAQDYYLTNGVTAVGNNGTITPLALTVSGSSVATKTYDGTTAATITGGVLNGVVSADQAYVSLATQGGTFASKNAGGAVPVTALDTLTVTGPAAGDYTLTEPTGLTGTITPLALNVSGSSVTPKTYDGTTAATITGGVLNGVVSADQAYVSLTQSGSFATKNAATGIPVTATDTLVLTGTATGDYTLSEPTGLTGAIAPRPVSLSNAETAAAKTYDGTTVATLSGGALSNMVAGDTDGLSLIGTFATPNAGQNIAVTVTLSGADAGNYVLAGAPSLAANIYPAPLVATANPLATPLGAMLPAFTGTFSGFVDGQTLAALEADGYQARWSSSVSNTSAPGRYAITGSFNDYNYSVVQAAANATAFDATLPTSSAGPFLGIALYSLGSLQAANGTATSGTAVGGSAAGATAVDGASASSAAASSAMVNSAGVGGASGASLGTAGSDASAEGMSASTVNGGGLTLGANATSTASDGTVTLVAVADGSASAGEVSAGAVGGSDTPPAQSEGSTATGMKNEWRRAFGVPLIVVSGGMNTSLVH